MSISIFSREIWIWQLDAICIHVAIDLREQHFGIGRPVSSPEAEVHR